MPPTWVYHLCGLLLLAANGAACVATFLLLPGTWVIFGLALLAAWFLPEDPSSGLGFGWGEAALLGLLALLGEITELFGGAAGAKQAGTSRRSVWLSIAGAIGGTVLGLTIGLPLPLIGPIVAGLLGGGFGAFVGAYIGEAWVGRRHAERVASGRAALVGSIIGRVGKLVISVLMLMLATAVYWLA
jgi:uncharacterized protein YqgC (DUF456 family)